MLPEWLDYAGGENVATAMFRGLRTTPWPWGELIASAQAVMGLFQDDLSGDLRGSTKSRRRFPIAAARILDAASQPPAGLPAEHRRDLALAGAVAFGMYGNFLLSAAVVRRSVLGVEDITPSLAVIVAAAAPSLVGEMIPCCPRDSVERSLPGDPGRLLADGGRRRCRRPSRRPDRMPPGRPVGVRGGAVRPAAYALELPASLVARTFREHLPRLPADLLRKLLDSGVYVLLPPQFKALVARRLASRSENAILALPTSTGKTLLGELCLASAP